MLGKVYKEVKGNIPDAVTPEMAFFGVGVIIGTGRIRGGNWTRRDEKGQVEFEFRKTRRERRYAGTCSRKWKRVVRRVPEGGTGICYAQKPPKQAR